MLTLLWLTVGMMVALGLMLVGWFGYGLVNMWRLPLEKWGWRHARAVCLFIFSYMVISGLLLLIHAYSEVIRLLAYS